MVVVALLCGLLGAVSLAALAGARRTESAYGRYLDAVHASDAYVNIPSPDTALIRRIESLPGVSSGVAWVGLDADPVIHGHVDASFVTNGFAGSVGGEFWTQDTVTVVAGKLPPIGSTRDVALTPGLARLFGVGVGGTVTYRFFNSLSLTNTPTGDATYRVGAIVELPPALVDQFDDVESAILPPAATAAAERRPGAVAFSWVGARLQRGDAGLPAFQASLLHLASVVGGGYTFAVRRMDTVHQQVQEAIRPQAVAVAVFGLAALLSLLVLVGQSLSQLLERTSRQAGVLRAIGLSRAETAAACGLGGALAILTGTLVAVAGAVALSPLAPVGPVRQYDPARGVQFGVTVLLGGGAVIAVLLLAAVAWLSWRAVASAPRPSPRVARTRAVTASASVPPQVALGISAALGAGERRRMWAWANIVGSVAAVTAVVTAFVFGASLNGLVTHPPRYGWNWNLLMQSQGGYGSFLPPNTTLATLGNGDGDLDHLMSTITGIKGWSTFGFTQLPIDGRVVPVLGVATHGGLVEPPTVSGQPLTGTGAVPMVPVHAGPDEIELGTSTLRQLGVHVGQDVTVGTGVTARHLRVVGIVTLPSIGVQLSDHVSLGRGAMLAESTLMAIENIAGFQRNPAEALSALPSTVAIDLDPGTGAARVAQRLASADSIGSPGNVYRVPRVRGAAIVNAGQMGGQPVALAVALAAAALIALSAALANSVRRRRRELAVLKTLGFTRAQMRVLVVAESCTLLLVAVGLGVPLGIGAGHLAWVSFAGALGVVPAIAVQPWPLSLGMLALVAAGVALAWLPAARAARTPTTVALRAE